MTERQFFYHLRQMGYEVKVGKDITVRPYDRPHGRKLARNFGEAYSLENIRRRILAQSRPQREQKPEPKQCRLHGDLKQAKKATGFRALYFHYCYLLGVFPQKKNRPPRRVPVSYTHLDVYKRQAPGGPLICSSGWGASSARTMKMRRWKSIAMSPRAPLTLTSTSSWRTSRSLSPRS